MIRSLPICLLLALPAAAAPVPKQAADAKAKEIAEVRARVEVHKKAAAGNREAERELKKAMDRAHDMATMTIDLRQHQSELNAILRFENALAGLPQNRPNVPDLRRRRILKQVQVEVLRDQIEKGLKTADHLMQDLYKLALYDLEQRGKK